ncbi:hypothetical protein GXP67_32640 [Rhodocytophaga rosea]|uniref:Uncharacterized protein n=1 Tax=Rhodocytophaga rosea TaxID=2704465 RepID=A0A6C0GTC7_9BACT|nr:hypothetical protein [Rhodocytophaga rosea]QHT71064.1 hypothetical protein GXP67_32640 [Rhodocytophaga rosea]
MFKIHTISGMLFLVCACLLSSCYKIPYRSTPQLVNIPLVPHTNEVELYFTNELPANKAYYEVIGLSAEGGTDYNALLLQLKKQAKQAGVDAVIHINNTNATYTSSDGGQYSTQVVKGVGIKYRDNMSHIEQYIKSKKVFKLSDSGNSVLIYEAPFDMLGHELKKDRKPDPLYTRFVRDFSFDYLLYETDRWAYSMDEKRRVLQRNHYADPYLNNSDFTCYFEYKSNDELESIQIKYPSNRKQNVYVELEYASKDKVSAKNIYAKYNKKNLLYVEKLEYDAQNRISQTTLYKVEAGKQIPFLQTNYSYYTMDDLPPLKNM